MKQIELPPESYRKQDSKGRWVENVDRGMARWMAAGGTAFMVALALSFQNEAPLTALLAFLVMGIAIGASIILSIWPKGH